MKHRSLVLHPQSGTTEKQQVQDMTIGYNSTLYTRSKEHSRLKREKETSYKEESEINNSESIILSRLVS